MGFHFSHLFHRVTSGTHLPPDDIALSLRISPSGLLKTSMDRDLTMKGLRPPLRDQTDTKSWIVTIPCSRRAALIESPLLRTAARFTTVSTLEAGPVPHHGELFTVGAGISFIALFACHFDGGQGQRFTLQFDGMGYVTISMAIALMTRYRPASCRK